MLLSLQVLLSFLKKNMLREYKAYVSLGSGESDKKLYFKNIWLACTAYRFKLQSSFGIWTLKLKTVVSLN